MIDTIVEMFSYPFMVRAFAVGSLVALCAALLGVSLVLKQYSMIGDGLSHVGFGALAVATAFQAAPLSVAIPVVVLAAVLILRIKGNGKIKGDAAIALISTTSLALTFDGSFRTPGCSRTPPGFAPFAKKLAPYSSQASVIPTAFFAIAIGEYPISPSNPNPGI